MPSETTDLKNLSPSSLFSEQMRFPNERQVGFWTAENLPNHNERKMSLNLEKHAVGPERAGGYSMRGPLGHDSASRSNLNTELPTSYLVEGSKINFMGAQDENGLFSSSLSELFSRKLRLSLNNNIYGHSVGAAASHNEEEDCFESLEEIEAQTIGNLLPSDDDLLSGVTDGLDYIARPNNGDEVEDFDLFSSVGGMDLGEDGSPPPQTNAKNYGGNSSIPLGGPSNSVAGEHPFGEHPSRTLFVRNINSNVEDSELRSLFEQYGDIRTLYTACKHRGFVMISYYDIRAALNALMALQNTPLRRRKLDIHFSIPKDNPSEKDINQGTLVVFNLDSSVSNDELQQIFGVHGDIKEIRETQQKSDKKFVEFYDLRAADAAYRALSNSDIAGKRIKLEARNPGGARGLSQSLSQELDIDESGPYMQLSSPPNNLMTGFLGSVQHVGFTSCGMDNGGGVFKSVSGSPMISPFLENTYHHGISSSVPSSLPSLVRMKPVGNQSQSQSQSNGGESRQLNGQVKFDLCGTPNFHPHSLPEYHDGLTNTVPSHSPGNMAANITSERIGSQHFFGVSSDGLEMNGGIFGSAGNGNCPPYRWSNSHHGMPPQNMMWPNSPSFMNGVRPPTRMHEVPRAPSHMVNTLLPIRNHQYVGSAPSVNPSLWERRQAYAGESSPEASVFHPGSLGNMRIAAGNAPHPLEFVPHNIFPRSGMELPISSKNVGFSSSHQQQGCLMFPGRGGQMMPMMSPLDSPTERARTRRNDGNSNQGDTKKQFELDIDRILRGEDKRTTLMIKNIPNKYTSKMLLAAIDERHKGTYDFIYLPIDFKNKCNVGYAFINMTDPSLIIPFYQAFNGKKWEKFNSEKVASLAYARIQGKSALIAHFQNSSLMNEDKRCRPILFHTDGPNAGDQVPFPMGVNIRPRPSKNRSSTNDENHQERPLDLANGEEYSNGDSSSSSVKDSD